MHAVNADVQLEEEGGGLPCPCSKVGKNALIVVIYELNFSFKMQFSRVSRRKKQKFFPKEPFFLVLYMIAHQSALTPRKLLYPKAFLVTRLRCLLLLISFASVIYICMCSRSSFRVIQK